jgi:hypothetical protein
MSTASSRPVVGRVTLLLAAHVLTWWSAVAMVIVIFGILVYRLLAERARRKTLESTYRYAPAGTIVVQGEGPGGPPMRIRVGEGPRPEPAATIVLQRIQERRRFIPWRRG